jgi:hypothetical protein
VKKATYLRAKPTFFKNVLHALFWSSFLELEEQFLNVCRTRLENVWLGSYEKDQMKIRIFQVFGHFDGIKKATNSKIALFFN